VTVGRSEYFRREAGDYLRELEPLLGSGSPPVEALVRLARGLRGAAMLAGHATLSQAAGELERVVKRLAEGTITWGEVAPAVRQAVGRFRQLVGSPQRWDRSNDDEATRVARELQSAFGAGTPGGSSTSHGRPRQDEAASYVARQARATADEVDRAARGIATKNPGVVELFANAQRSMQTLRGLAGLEEFSPLPELLDATDTLLTELQRTPRTEERDGDVLSLGAAAIETISRSVADGTPPVVDDPQVTSFTDALFARLSRHVIPIADLLDPHDPEPVTPYGGREGPGLVSPQELVAMGESLLRAGREIQLTRTHASRRLLAVTHALTLRTMRGGLGRRPTGRFVATAVACLEGRVGIPLESAGSVLEQAGTLLASSHSGAEGITDLQRTESALDDLADRLAPAVPSDTMSEHRAPIVSIESLLSSDPVPIESLILSEPIPIGDLLVTDPVSIDTLLATDPTPIAVLAPDPQPDRTPLERSLSTYSRLLQMEVVPIERLLLRGRRALERANQLRAQLEGALPTAQRDRERLEPLFQELLDLVPLALVTDD